jgi:hypothetical protein
MASDRHGTTDPRGGGDRTRSDAFRYAPRKVRLGTAAAVVLAATALAAAGSDLGNARADSTALGLAAGGAFLILFGVGLLWMARRRPILLVVGPEGLDLPLAFATPAPWSRVARLTRVRHRIFPLTTLTLLRADLVRGATPDYKRTLLTMPRIDGWLARRAGLSIPIHNLDADEATILASVARFRPVDGDPT